MFKNYILTAWRNLKRQKTNSVINILGLSVGLGIFILIALFVRHELSHDRFHKNLDRIYRLETNGKVNQIAVMAEIISEKVPEIEAFNRFSEKNMAFSHQGDALPARRVIFGDTTLFRIFSFDLLRGDAGQVLQDPNGIVLTEKAARDWFGTEDAVGKTLVYDNDLVFTVTGIAEDIPDNSSIYGDVFASFDILPELYPVESKEELWTSYANFPAYFMLQPGADAGYVEKKINHEMLLYNKNRQGEEFDAGKFGNPFHLRPLRDVYFASGMKWDYFVKHGHLSFVRVFVAIGIFLLLLASINFINLSTARGMMRSREVGIRKVSGSPRSKLILQFLTESVAVCLVAVVIGLFLAEALLPLFNEVTLSDIQIRYTPAFFSAAILGAVVLGVIAGIYPAFYLSSYKPVSILKGGQISGKKGSSARKGLMVLQYVISIVLIISTLVVYSQMDYMKNKDMGYNKDQVYHFRAEFLNQGKHQALREQLLKNPRIKDVSFSVSIPGYLGMSQSFRVGGEGVSMASMPVGEHFFDMMDVDFVRGRSFLGGSDYDKMRSYIINEAAAKVLGEEDIIGRKMQVWDRQETGQIVGVVKDFHFKSLKHQIKPLVMYYKPEWCYYVMVQLDKQETSATLEYIEQTARGIHPGFTMNGGFLEDTQMRLYRKEERYGKLFGYFAIVSILIASLGLFGLALFTVVQKNKEIAVRKVFGSGSKRIVGMLSRDFTRWVVLANLVAWPVGYYLMDRWLMDFAYRTAISWRIFGAAMALSLGIALFTVIFQSMKAANTNPARVLRDE